MKQTIGIIGSGIGGLACAIRLKIKGYDILVFEKNDQPGGKISELKTSGYRFDTGPTVFTMPELVNDLFDLAGKDPSRYFSYSSLSQSCRYFYEEGTVIDAYADSEHFIREVHEKTGEPPENVRRFLNKSRTIYELTADLFVFNAMHDPKNVFKRSSLKALFNFPRLDAFRTMHQVNQRIFNSQKVVQLFDRYATYNGSNPYKAPGTLNIIAHLEHNMGLYFPDRGMYSIVRALYKLGKELGVKFLFNTPVKQLEAHGKQINALHTHHDTYHFDHIVSDVDINYFYSHLLRDSVMLKKVLKPEKSSSALIFFWEIKQVFPKLKLHNILFAGNYLKEFDYLFHHKSICDDPTVYIFIGSKFIPGDAPADCENWYVMVNAPENVGQDWIALAQKVKRYIIQKIKRILYINIEKYMHHEVIMYPSDIESHTSSWNGSLYGNSSNGRYAAFNRHPNFSRRCRNLYFTGGSVHPGGGIPLCLSSAKIVADQITAE